MKVLKNKWDSEFEEVGICGAKEYFQQDEKPGKEDYTGDDYEAYCRNIAEFNKDLESCGSLEEVADLLNSVSDVLGNGTEYYVETI